MTTPSQIQKDLIKWRRAKVIELVSKGKNLSEIAEILKVDVSTVSRDYQYIRENAIKVLEKYLVETVPLEMAKCLSRLTAISDEAWSMVERAKDDKEKAAALALAQRTAVLILNVVTNNKAVVDDALKFSDSVESKGRQKEAKNKINELSRKKSRSKESNPAETVF
jgi:hypothetical protein